MYINKHKTRTHLSFVNYWRKALFSRFTLIKLVLNFLTCFSFQMHFFISAWSLPSATHFSLSVTRLKSLILFIYQLLLLHSGSNHHLFENEAFLFDLQYRKRKCLNYSCFRMVKHLQEDTTKYYFFIQIKYY